MKSRLVLLLMCVSTLSGCATARFYPVQGPLSTQTPVPVYVAKLSGAFNSGNFSVVLGDGEVCKGRWAKVPRPKTSNDVTTTTAVPANNLSAEWDTVYGTGFYLAHVLGARLYARAVLTGNRGTVLNVELYKPDKVENTTVAAIKGVAKDNKGNIYKVAF
jgi:lysozyme family protein